MFHKFIKLVIGDIDDKRQYKLMMKRVKLLPKDYNFAFRKIQKYMYTVGPLNGDIEIFIDLLELFESSVADNREIIDVIGSDVGKFCDEFMKAYCNNTNARVERINNDIKEKFNKESR